MRAMYDSIDVRAIPKDAPIVAGYVDGHWPTYASLVKLWPNAAHVSITVFGWSNGQHTQANVCDCEQGDLTPPQAAKWAAEEVAAGRIPTIYCSLSPWPTVRAEVEAAGITGKVRYWIACYDRKAEIPEDWLALGAVAKQYDDIGPSGENLDSSVAVDHWPGVDPEPQEDDMAQWWHEGSGTEWAVTGTSRFRLTSPAQRQGWQDAGLLSKTRVDVKTNTQKAILSQLPEVK